MLTSSVICLILLFCLSCIMYVATHIIYCLKIALCLYFVSVVGLHCLIL